MRGLRAFTVVLVALLLLDTWPNLQGIGGRINPASASRAVPASRSAQPPRRLQAATTWTVTDTSDSASDTGSLRYAIDHAQNGDTITFDPVVFSITQTITLSSPLAIASAVTIIGPGANLLKLDGANQLQVLSIPSGVQAAISGVTVAHGNAANGGGIANGGTLTLTNSTLSGNEASGSQSGALGGGIYNTGTLTVTNSILSGNSTSGNYYIPGGGYIDVSGYGGGVYNIGTLAVINSTLSGNSANDGNLFSGGSASYGGGIYNNNKLTVINSTLSGNSANDNSYGAYGGGIYNDNGGTLAVSNSTLSDNSASGYIAGSGGGIYNDKNGTLTLTNSTLSSNSASSFNNFGGAGTGGGISNGGILTLTNSTLSGNSASGYYSSGGGIFNDNGGTLAVSNSTLSGNSTNNRYDDSGGGIDNNGTLTITGSTLSNNSAGSGGGIFNNGALTLTNSTLSGNSASDSYGSGTDYGGGIDNNDKLTITNSTLSGNSASSGGGIFNNGTLTVISSTLSGNSASGGLPGYGGGIIDDNVGVLTLTNSVVAGDSPDDIPGYSAPNTDIVGLTVGGTTYTLGQILAVQGDGVTPLLADNGGPTQTIALVARSPALGLGRNCVGPDGTTPLTTDQRGYSRPDAPASCDAGAYEHQGPPVTPIPTFTPTTTSTGTATATATATATPTVTATPSATATPQLVTYNIQAGWNLFAYSEPSTSTATASQLLTTILHQSNGSLAAIYGLTQGRWFPGLIDTGGSFSPPTGDFLLQPATCYLIYSDRDSTLTLPVVAASSQHVVYPIQQGWNLFATSATLTIPTAAGLLGALLQQSTGSLDALYGLTNGHWSPGLIDAGGSFIGRDFPLQPITGYLLYSDQPVTFSVQAAARHSLVPLQGNQRVSPATQRRIQQLLPPLPLVP